MALNAKRATYMETGKAAADSAAFPSCNCLAPRADRLFVPFLLGVEPPLEEGQEPGTLSCRCVPGIGRVPPGCGRAELSRRCAGCSRIR